MTTTKKPSKPDLTVVGKGGQNRKRPGGNRIRATQAEAKRLEDEARDAEAWKMSFDGKTFRQIADHMGWSAVSTVHTAIQRHVNRTPVPVVEQIKMDQITSLRQAREWILSRLPGASDTAGSRLVGALVQIEARLAALTGADAPKRTELSGRDGGPIVFADEEDVKAWMLAARNVLDRRLQVVGD